MVVVVVIVEELVGFVVAALSQVTCASLPAESVLTIGIM
jgi:hypothetical protein